MWHQYSKRMNNSHLLHVSWDRWEHLEGKLVCSTSRTRQLFWSCPREHNLILCLLDPSLVILSCVSQGSCLGRNKTSVSFSPFYETGSYWYTSLWKVVCFVALMKGAMKVWSVCASNCLHSCRKWSDVHNTLAEGRVCGVKQEPFQHDPLREKW